jgi:hypothetical protein
MAVTAFRYDRNTHTHTLKQCDIMQQVLCNRDIDFFHCELHISNSILMEAMVAVHFYVRRFGIQQQCR